MSRDDQELDFIDLYSIPAVAKLSGAKQFHNVNETKTRISFPTRMAVIGATGSLKTQTALNTIVRHFKCVNTFVLVAKKLKNLTNT